MSWMGVFNRKSENRRPFKIGDLVRVRYRDQEGWIVDQNGDYFMVSLSGSRHVESYKGSELEHVEI